MKPVPSYFKMAAKELGKPPFLIQSPQLFQGRKEILISHEGQLYRLRITRQNKLILTK